MEETTPDLNHDELELVSLVQVIDVIGVRPGSGVLSIEVIGV